MKANTLLAVGGASAVTGFLVARCVSSRSTVVDVEEEALLEEAFKATAAPAPVAEPSSAPAAEPAAAAQPAAAAAPVATDKDLIGTVIAELEERASTQVLAPPQPAAGAQAAAAAAAAAQGGAEEKVKGFVSKDDDGNSLFVREDMGLRFTVGKEWVGSEEYAESMAHGTTWIARFGDPASTPQMGPGRQLVMIVEQVGNEMSLQQYAEKSMATAQETMGQFAQVHFSKNDGCSIGVFRREMVYSLMLPAMMGGPMSGPMELKHLSYIALKDGIAYTVQYMSPAPQFDEHVASFETIAKSVSICEVKALRGVFVRQNENLTVTLPMKLDLSLAPPSNPPPASLTQAFKLGGKITDTYTPERQGACLSLIVDEDVPEGSVAEFVRAKMPAEIKDDLQVIAEDSSDQWEHAEFTCFSQKNEPVAVSMVRLAKSPKVRIAAWFTIAQAAAIDRASFHTEWQVNPAREHIVNQLKDFAACVDYSSTAFETPRMHYRNPLRGLAFTGLAEKSSVQDNFLGEICLVYRPDRDEQVPDLQLLSNATKPSMEAWIAELKGELERAQGMVQEESTGWLGREKMHQIIARYVLLLFCLLRFTFTNSNTSPLRRVPGPPVSDYPNAPPTVLTCFITMVNMPHKSYMYVVVVCVCVCVCVCAHTYPVVSTLPPHIPTNKPTQDAVEVHGRAVRRQPRGHGGPHRHLPLQRADDGGGVKKSDPKCVAFRRGRRSSFCG